MPVKGLISLNACWGKVEKKQCSSTENPPRILRNPTWRRQYTCHLTHGEPPLPEALLEFKLLMQSLVLDLIVPQFWSNVTSVVRVAQIDASITAFLSNTVVESQSHQLGNVPVFHSITWDLFSKRVKIVLKNKTPINCLRQFDCSSWKGFYFPEVDRSNVYVTLYPVQWIHPWCSYLDFHIVPL